MALGTNLLVSVFCLSANVCEGVTVEVYPVLADFQRRDVHFVVLQYNSLYLETHQTCHLFGEYSSVGLISLYDWKWFGVVITTGICCVWL